MASLPDRVPVRGVGLVVKQEPVLEDARGAHREGVRGAVIVRRVDGDPHHVARGEIVAPRQRASDRLRTRVVTGHPDVERGLVLEDPHLGPLGRGAALVREDLHELRPDARVPPRGLLEPAVDAEGARGAFGDDGIPLRVGRRRGGECQDERRRERAHSAER
jgi:hypothetical protein